MIFSEAVKDLEKGRRIERAAWKFEDKFPIQIIGNLLCSVWDNNKSACWLTIDDLKADDWEVVE